jgi:adenosylcobinamide-GDP ribazoletransferase
MNSLRHFLLAVQFLTRIPVTGALANWVGFSPEMLRKSAAHFPAVGAVVGAAGAAVAWLSFRALGVDAAWISAVLSMAATLLITGGFHEDGLADTADGLGGTVSPERAVDIMKDSRIGAYGAIALVVALLLKAALLAHLLKTSAWHGALAIVWAHTASRWVLLGVMATLAHVGDLGASKSKPLADAASPATLAVASLHSLAVAALMLWAGISVASLGVALVAVALSATYMRRRLRIRLGGFTGDTLGATQQIAEIAVYLSLVALWAHA